MLAKLCNCAAHMSGQQQSRDHKGFIADLNFAFHTLAVNVNIIEANKQDSLIFACYLVVYVYLS